MQSENPEAFYGFLQVEPLQYRIADLFTVSNTAKKEGTQ